MNNTHQLSPDNNINQNTLNDTQSLTKQISVREVVHVIKIMKNKVLVKSLLKTIDIHKTSP